MIKPMKMPMMMMTKMDEALGMSTPAFSKFSPTPRPEMPIVRPAPKGSSGSGKSVPSMKG